MRKLWLGAGAVFALLLCVGAVILISNDSEAKSLSHKNATLLDNREEVRNLSGRSESSKYFRIDVPRGASDLVFSAYSKEGKEAVDLYARRRKAPTQKVFDAREIGPDGTKMLAIADPEPGTWYLMVHAEHGSYDDLSLVASYARPHENFKIGMHAHRLFNGGGGSGMESAPPQFHYGLVRDWDISGLQDAVVWRPDGSIDFDRIDRVYEGHAKHDARVLKTFGTVPTWASKRPDEPNKQFPAWRGAKSGPRDLDEYEDYVYRFISHTRDYLWGVEGWNEPYSCPGDGKTEFTTMTPTELADVQKRLYRAAKRVDPKLPVLSPAQAYVCGIPTLLEARTSEGEPIGDFFDMLAWHPYNRSARGNAGPSYAEEAMTVRRYLDRAGLRKPIADTEHGWMPGPKEGGRAFEDMTDDQKARVLYDTARLAKSLGIATVIWYAYDNSMIGKPMASAEISGGLEQMYRSLNR